MTISYKHAPDMGEISGFGGGYEQACQDMLHAGVEWIIANKVSIGDIKAHGYSGVYGLLIADNVVAKELEKVIVGAVEDCTGAMHHAVMSRCMWIARNGWEAYCEECRKPRKD